MRNMAWVLVLLAASLLTTNAWALEGVEAIEEVWNDSIADGNYLPSVGGTLNQPPAGPEGIQGGVMYSDMSPAPWSWVKGMAKETTYTRWVNTSMWGGGGISHIYVMNANYSYMHIPRGYHYYMSGFCWSPPDSVDYPPQPVEGPSNPKGREAATISPVYLTQDKYGNPPGGKLAIRADIYLTLGLAW